MFREMRRKDKELPQEEMLEILKAGQYGILSTIGEDGYPYGVPVNYIYEDGRIYYHTAPLGHKVENVVNSSKVSFCVVCDVENLPSEFNTKFRSVIAFGEASEAEGEKKDQIYKLLIEKYSMDFFPEGMEYVKNAGAMAKTYEIQVQHITAKGKK